MLRVVGWAFWIISLVFLAGWALILVAFSLFYVGWTTDSWGIVMFVLTFVAAPSLIAVAALFHRKGRFAAAPATLGIAWLSFTASFTAAGAA